MDETRAAIRRDAMRRWLNNFNQEATRFGASPMEVIAALNDNGARVYAVMLSGAVTEKEKLRAYEAAMRGSLDGMRDLPMATDDALIEAQLIRTGYGK